MSWLYSFIVKSTVPGWISAGGPGVAATVR